MLERSLPNDATSQKSLLSRTAGEIGNIVFNTRQQLMLRLGKEIMRRAAGEIPDSVVKQTETHRTQTAALVFIAPHIVSGGGIAASDSIVPDFTAFQERTAPLAPQQTRELIKQAAQERLARLGISVGPEV